MSLTTTVSIIVPIYNVSEYIGECIQSIINQSYRNIEIILVDDCGTDDSIAIAENLLRDSELTWKTECHSTNRGLAAARNTGVAAATGEYLFFIDSDDFISTDAIEKLINQALDTQAEITFGNCLDYENGQLSPGYATRAKETKLESNPLLAHFSNCACSTAWNKLIKTSWYKGTGISFVEGLLHEDEPWSLSLAFHAKKIAYLDSITYYYRQRGNSIMSSSLNLNKKIESRLYLLEYANKSVTLCPDELRYKYYCWVNRHVITSLENIVRYNTDNVKTDFNKALAYMHFSGAHLLKDKSTKRLVITKVLMLILNVSTAHKLADYIVRPLFKTKSKLKYLFNRHKSSSNKN